MPFRRAMMRNSGQFYRNGPQIQDQSKSNFFKKKIFLVPFLFSDGEEMADVNQGFRNLQFAK